MVTPARFLVLDAKPDGSFAPITDAAVTLGRSDLIGESRWPHADLLQTHFESDGHYVNSTGDVKNEPAAGQWLLVVRKPGRSTVVQRLTFSVEDDVIRRAWTKVHEENKVRDAIRNGMQAGEAWKKYGVL